ncbi:hypothetical protein [Cellulomonas uda]|uniref:Uncharacterized protein n=1 Tax=Cellulomonas uda TaxID=1714 RepID=A0A4Y3K8F8_CELUD|nr:hypothetical protein [Cellulomonas uda]NII67738.1 hypothetical protein [Cellulomonas uda]GEA80016.1 hypothetical protein CUD01_04600 [Cellulomonas uda]
MARRGVPLRWCLAAYPPRWRAAREHEVAGLLADLADDEQAGADPGRVSVPEALGLVRAGLATRVRTGPPLRTRAAYRMLDARIPARHRGWAHDEQHSVAGAVGDLVWSAMPFAIAAALMRELSFTVVAALMLPVVLLRRELHGERRRAKHLVAQPGEPPTPWDLAWAWVPRRRVAARPALRRVAVGALVATAAALGVVLTAPGHIAVTPCGRACVEVDAVAPGGPGALGVGILVGAVLLGLVLAVVVVAGLRGRRRRALPAQPHRIVVPAGRATGLAALLVVGLLVWLVALERSAAPGLSYLVASCGLVVLLVSAAALGALHGAGHGALDGAASPGGGRELALVDVLALAVGRVPATDTPRAAVVPDAVPDVVPDAVSDRRSARSAARDGS